MDFDLHGPGKMRLRVLVPGNVYEQFAASVLDEARVGQLRRRC